MRYKVLECSATKQPIPDLGKSGLQSETASWTGPCQGTGLGTCHLSFKLVEKMIVVPGLRTRGEAEEPLPARVLSELSLCPKLCRICRPARCWVCWERYQLLKGIWFLYLCPSWRNPDHVSSGSVNSWWSASSVPAPPTCRLGKFSRDRVAESSQAVVPRGTGGEFQAFQPTA